MSVYENVVAYCKKNNLSIAAFEKRCGLGNGTVGKWEKYSNLPSLTTLEKMQKATKVSINKWIKEDAFV